MVFSSKDKDRDMSITAHADLRNYAATSWPNLNHKGRLRELCRELSWNARRVRAVYNAEPGVSLRANEQADINTLIRAAQDEHRDLAERIARLEALLLHQDEGFNRPQVDAYRQGLRGGR